VEDVTAVELATPDDREATLSAAFTTLTADGMHTGTVKCEEAVERALDVVDAGVLALD
jgi:hypothetical protein